jgi:hypothetical protein
MGNGPHLDIEKQKAKLEKQIDVLKEEAILEPQRADDLKSKLDRIRREARGKEPVKTLDALDALKDMVSKTAKEAAESIARKSEGLGRAETLADVLKKRPEMSPKLTAEGMKQLADLANKAAADNELLKQSMEIDKELMDALKAGKLTKEQLEKLKGIFKDVKGDLAKTLAKLAKAELIDPETLAKAEEAGESDTEGLRAYLKDNGASDELGIEVEGSEEGGRGGVDRGPGPAAMLWKDPTTEDGFKYKEEALPPAKLKALKDSKTAGLSAGSPQKGAEGGPADAGALAGSAAGGGSASTQVVLPRHRGAVERYFDRPGK